jgi:hypothetical protein
LQQKRAAAAAWKAEVATFQGEKGYLHRFPTPLPILWHVASPPACLAAAQQSITQAPSQSVNQSVKRSRSVCSETRSGACDSNELQNTLSQKRSNEKVQNQTPEHRPTPITTMAVARQLALPAPAVLI